MTEEALAGSLYTNGPDRVLSGAGDWGSNGVVRSVFVAGQPSPPGLSVNGAAINYGGFLGMFVMFPGRDTDGDGIADENDPDNDDDALGDALELAGSGFSPGTPTDPAAADTDGDGMPDGAEAAAGTNPTNAQSRLEITSVRLALPFSIVTWRGRSGYTYDLICATNLTAFETAPVTLDTVTSSGGAAPWYETETVSTNVVGGERLFYRVRVYAP